MLVVRVVAGGAIVSAFAILSDTLKPKMFSGLFSAAPSVAIVSLLFTGWAMGDARDAKYATGMIAGAIGLVFYSFAAAFLVKHMRAVLGTVLAWAAWAIPAGLVYVAFVR